MVKIETQSNSALLGFLATFFSFLLWGILPIYWEKMFYLPFFGVASYRVIWSFIFISVVITATRQWGTVATIFKDKRAVLLLFVCGMLIAVNWSTYLLAISSAHIIESSMGYYINPLANALIGMIFFRERLRFLQKAAILLALIGVLYMVIGYGKVPYIALILAFSFAFYAAVHKLVKVSVLDGMFFEMLIILIPALSYVVIMSQSGVMPTFMAEPISMKVIIAMGGALTAIPLLGFAFGVQKLPLTTVGVIQYVSPTVTFLLGVFHFKEPISTEVLIVFSMIWVGVALYALDGVLQTTRKK
ncbi:MAG: EamA family transporter RarD [Deferribacteraceae bacterium]|jgi:chloramphenicol-sensitive protein RarD|nr:EamA family transporter RarD [Deferribacteraceae bacterium]